MDHSLRETLLRSGANLEGANHMALHFGDAEAELRAALDCCAIVDRSDLGLVLLSRSRPARPVEPAEHGRGQGPPAGQGRPTVVTTPKGRIVERLLCTTWAAAACCWSVDRIGRAGHRISQPLHLRRAEAGMTDATDEFCQLTVVGPQAKQYWRQPGSITEPFCSVDIEFEGVSAHVLGENGLSGEGYSVLVKKRDGRLDVAGAEPGLQQMRRKPGGIDRSRGLAHPSRTADVGPRVDRRLQPTRGRSARCRFVRQGVLRRPRGRREAEQLRQGVSYVGGARPASAGGASTDGDQLYFEDQEVGRVTSAVAPPGWPHPVALAYVKRRMVEKVSSSLSGRPARASRLVWSTSPSRPESGGARDLQSIPCALHHRVSASTTALRLSERLMNGARDSSSWTHGISAAWVRVM